MTGKIEIANIYIMSGVISGPEMAEYSALFMPLTRGALKSETYCHAFSAIQENKNTGTKPG